MILAIALPIVIQSLFTNIVALLDNVMVGKVGTDLRFRMVNRVSLLTLKYLREKTVMN